MTRLVKLEMEAEAAKQHASNISWALSLIEKQPGSDALAARKTLEAVLSGIGMGLGQLPRETP